MCSDTLHQEYISKEKEESQQEFSSSFSPEKIKEMYSLAYYLYRDQHYEKAIHLFRLLTLIDPLDPRYWKGFGASLQMVHRYEEALRCYICAEGLNQDQSDPYLYIHAADCYFALNHIKAGLKSLETARLNGERQNDEKVLKHVAFMHERWSNQ